MSAETAVLNPSLAERAEQYERRLMRALARLTPFDKRMIVIGVGLAACLELGAQTAVNIVLTDMKGNVAAGPNEISWVLIVYSAAFLCAMPLTTWLARSLGHRNSLVLFLLLYAGGALGCFASGRLDELLAARAVMGFGGGGFLIRGVTTIFRLYDGKARAAAFLLFALLINLSRALLPVGFAAITDSAGWNLAFLAIVPPALLAAVVLYLYVPGTEEVEADAESVDGVGTALIVVGLVAFQVFASRGQQDQWLASPLMRAMLAVSLACLAGFFWRDIRRDNSHPLLNLRLLRAEPSLAAGLGVAFILGVVLGAGFYVLPLYLRGIQGYSATQTSVFFAVGAAATYLGIVIALRRIQKWTPRGVLLAGFLLFLAANFLFVHWLAPDTPARSLDLIIALDSVALGMLVAGTGFLLLGPARPRYMTFATAIYFFFRQLGASLGVAASVVLLDFRETLHSRRLLESANRMDPAVRQFAGHLSRVLGAKGLPKNVSALGAYRIFQGLVGRQTSVLAFIDFFWCLEFLAAAGIVLLLVSWYGEARRVEKERT